MKAIPLIKSENIAIEGSLHYKAMRSRASIDISKVFHFTRVNIFTGWLIGLKTKIEEINYAKYPA